MKKLSDIFELPVSGVDIQGSGIYFDQQESDRLVDDAIAHAINHVDALADALEGLLNRLHYEGCDFADMAVAATALEAYRGEA
jgi:hypothetical protein